jgi:hypothetical protein
MDKKLAHDDQRYAGSEAVAEMYTQRTERR